MSPRVFLSEGEAFHPREHAGSARPPRGADSSPSPIATGARLVAAWCVLLATSPIWVTACALEWSRMKRCDMCGIGCHNDRCDDCERKSSVLSVRRGVTSLRRPR